MLFCQQILRGIKDHTVSLGSHPAAYDSAEFPATHNCRRILGSFHETRLFGEARTEKKEWYQVLCLATKYVVVKAVSMRRGLVGEFAWFCHSRDKDAQLKQRT